MGWYTVRCAVMKATCLVGTEVRGQGQNTRQHDASFFARKMSRNSWRWEMRAQIPPFALSDVGQANLIKNLEAIWSPFRLVGHLGFVWFCAVLQLPAFLSGRRDSLKVATWASQDPRTYRLASRLSGITVSQHTLILWRGQDLQQ